VRSGRIILFIYFKYLLFTNYFYLIFLFWEMAFGPQSRAVEAGLLFIYYLFSLFLFLLFYSGK